MPAWRGVRPLRRRSPVAFQLWFHRTQPGLAPSLPSFLPEDSETMLHQTADRCHASDIPLEGLPVAETTADLLLSPDHARFLRPHLDVCASPPVLPPLQPKPPTILCSSRSTLGLAPLC